MFKSDRMIFAIAILFFIVFAANILMTKFVNGAFVDDVGEALLMAVAVLFFTAGTLMREAKKN